MPLKLRHLALDGLVIFADGPGQGAREHDHGDLENKMIKISFIFVNIFGDHFR